EQRPERMIPASGGGARELDAPTQVAHIGSVDVGGVDPVTHANSCLPVRPSCRQRRRPVEYTTGGTVPAWLLTCCHECTTRDGISTTAAAGGGGERRPVRIHPHVVDLRGGHHARPGWGAVHAGCAAPAVRG